MERRNELTVNSKVTVCYIPVGNGVLLLGQKYKLYFLNLYSYRTVPPVGKL